MKTLSRILPFAVAAALVGCQNSTSGSGSTTKPAPSAPVANPAPAEPKLADLPAELKNEAYEWYGLENTKPMDMEIVDSEAPDSPRTGAQTTTLTSVADGKAVFEVTRSGGLSDLGTQEISLEKDGIYVTSSDVAKVDHDLEIPNDLTVGKTWETKMVVDKPGNSMDLTNTFKVVGVRKIKTKVGEREAILITSKGKGTMGGQDVTMTSENYYTKGVGGVKAVITITYPDKKSRTLTIQEIKAE